ncbi:MAG: MBL fold metallo-hydrolase [Candidatus Paceibacterota bacterium]
MTASQVKKNIAKSKSWSDYLVGPPVYLLLIGLVFFNLWLWPMVFSAGRVTEAISFLSVGQGDAQLISLAGPGLWARPTGSSGRAEARFLIDAGAGRQVLEALDQVLGPNHRRRLDVLIITHPDLDHYGGFIDVIKYYDVGLIITNGQESEAEAWRELMTEIAKRDIPVLTLAAGDVINFGNKQFSVLAPDEDFFALADGNEASLVLMLKTDEVKVLLTGDIGHPAEDLLLTKGYNLEADILKVGHHGSRFSTGENFITAVRPRLAVIGVGRNNYGHPTDEVLSILDLAGSIIYRTDLDGTVKVLLTKELPTGTWPEANSRLGAWLALLTGEYKGNQPTVISWPTFLATARPDFNLVPVTACVFKTADRPSGEPVIFSEIAWMGASTGATHEWVELRNLTGQAIDLSGWQIINQNERIHLTLPQQTLFTGQFFLLARQATMEALNLEVDTIFTGAIRNQGEGLRLFDNDCNLIDEVLVPGNWPAGDNQTKQTMERTAGLNWQTSSVVGGSPGFD